MKRTFAVGVVVAAMSTVAAIAQPPTKPPSASYENKWLIGLTVKLRPDFHCSNGLERAFLLDVAKRRPQLVPLSPNLAGTLPYPLMLDTNKQTPVPRWGSEPATTEFAQWFNKRRGVLVYRGSPPFASKPDDCEEINKKANFDVYAIPLATPGAALSPTMGVPTYGANRDNEQLQQLKSPSGENVGWVFRSTQNSTSAMWATDLKGEHATRIDASGIHGCSLSPRDPILACEDPGSGPPPTVLGIGIKILAGSHWHVVWAPDGSGFLDQATLEHDPNLTIYFYPVDRKNAVVGSPTSMVPDGWLPSGCCQGDLLHYNSNVKKYCPSVADFAKRGWRTASGDFRECPSAGDDPKPEDSGWPWGSDVYTWSPNAKWIYYSATKPGKGRTILKVSVGDPRHFYPITEGVVQDAVHPQVSPDGNYLAFLSSGPHPKAEPGRCLAESKEEFNVQLYTMCLTCERRQESIRQKTHLGCNTLIVHMVW